MLQKCYKKPPEEAVCQVIAGKHSTEREEKGSQNICIIFKAHEKCAKEENIQTFRLYSYHFGLKHFHSFFSSSAKASASNTKKSLTKNISSPKTHSFRCIYLRQKMKIWFMFTSPPDKITVMSFSPDSPKRLLDSSKLFRMLQPALTRTKNRTYHSHA